MALVVKHLWPLKQLRHWPTWLTLLASAGPSLAVGPAAPFAPPSALPSAAAVSSPGALAASAAEPGNDAAQPREPEATGLLGVHRSGPAALALIDGRWWSVGSQLRGAQLIHIQRHQATLRHPDGRLEVLALYSGTHKTTGTAGKAVTLPMNQPARTP